MNKLTIALTALSLLVLTACTGGPAGDNIADPEAVRLVSELEGLYALPRDWDGTNTEAFLEINTPNAAGIAAVFVSREDSTNNCFQADIFEGTASKDDFSDRIFLDGITDLEVSVVSLASTNTLQIEPAAASSLFATRVTSITSMDIQFCD